MQSFSTVFVALSGMLAMMLAGHFSLTRGLLGRGWMLAFSTVFALQSGLLLSNLVSPGVLPLSLRAVVGASLPPMIYLFFARGTALPNTPLCWRDISHGMSVLAVLVLALMPDSGFWLDAAMVTIESGYALALLSLNRSGGEAGAIRRRAILAVASLLFAVAILDVFIAFELATDKALSQSLALVVAGMVLLLFLLTWFIWAWRNPEWFHQLQNSVVEAAQSALSAPPTRDIDPANDKALCQRLDAFLREQQGYAQFGLSLASTAEQLAVTARQLSDAVNRVHGRGFRTLVNDHRVNAAARLLSDPTLSQRPITDIMFDAGFQTKSNFNKEFISRMGVTPSEFRARSATSFTLS